MYGEVGGENLGKQQGRVFDEDRLYSFVEHTYNIPYTEYTQDIENIGNRFGHRSRLDESSGRISTIFLCGFALHVYSLFSEIG